MNKITKKRLKKSYEIFGEAIDIKKFLSEINDKYIKLDHRLIFDVKNDINIVIMDRLYIRSVIENILTNIYNNVEDNITDISIYRDNNNLNILISAKFANFIDNFDINDILISFIMELHNGNYKTDYSSNRFDILMSFPDYRIINFIEDL